MLGFGYRFVSETVFATGFALGAVSIAMTTNHLLVDKSYRSLGVWVAFILGGAVCGGMAMWVYPKSSFITGIAGGVIVAVVVANSAAYYICAGQTQELFTLLCFLFAIVFASFALKYGRPVESVGINIFGAGIVVWGLGYFIGDFPSLNELEKYATRNADGNLEYTIPTLWWGYVGGIALLAALGMFVHHRKTGRLDVSNDFAVFETTGIVSAIDAALNAETEKQRLTIPVMDQSTDTAWEPDFLPSSYPSAVHQSFCRLYSRNTEAQAISKMRSNFFETRASETKGAIDDSRNPFGNVMFILKNVNTGKMVSSISLRKCVMSRKIWTRFKKPRKFPGTRTGCSTELCPRGRMCRHDS
uniref:Transmembrane protein 198 n=1 Tax=Hyaloperonospora arabidopsidis (strain Emoy2) TaxID=559515 RepID=M4BJG3_HYAAE